MITIVDYGSGNIAALGNIYTQLNIPFRFAARPQELVAAEKLILPGVGAFDRTMDLLNESKVTEVLNELVMERKVPILGICVGMQVMAGGSDEGCKPGFGWIDGHVRKFDISCFSSPPHLPHMGWNSVTPVRESPLFEGIDQERGFYFLHSYFFSCTHRENALSETCYGISYASAVGADNIYGVQFHPEKSHSNGVRLLANFAGL